MNVNGSGLLASRANLDTRVWNTLFWLKANNQRPKGQGTIFLAKMLKRYAFFMQYGDLVARGVSKWQDKEHLSLYHDVDEDERHKIRVFNSMVHVRTVKGVPNGSPEIAKWLVYKVPAYTDDVWRELVPSIDLWKEMHLVKNGAYDPETVPSLITN